MVTDGQSMSLAWERPFQNWLLLQAMWQTVQTHLSQKNKADTGITKNQGSGRAPACSSAWQGHPPCQGASLETSHEINEHPRRKQNKAKHSKAFFCFFPLKIN